MEQFESTTVISPGRPQVHEASSVHQRSPRVIYHKQKRIVYIDFSHIKKPEEIYALMDDAHRFISTSLPKSVLTLTNLTGMHFNNEIFSRFINYVKSNNPYVKVSAVIGMSGMMQIFYNSFTRLTGRDVRAFSFEHEAKEYLVSK